MRIHTIACVAIYLGVGAGCSGELAERPPARDPTSVAAAEAPFARPPAWQPDPLTSTPPAASPPAPPPQPQPQPQPQQPPSSHGAPGAAAEPSPGGYTCPMHPDVHAAAPGSCPRCGMALVRAGERGGAP